MRRFHYNIFFPNNIADMLIDFFNQFDKIGFTNHALEEMKNDKFGNIPVPSKEDLLNNSNIVVEYYEPISGENPSGYIQKILLRVRHMSSKYDYSYLLAREGFIVSAWSNEKSDIHRLTNENNYYRPREMAV